jgi:hypothetical protein
VAGTLMHGRVLRAGRQAVVVVVAKPLGVSCDPEHEFSLSIVVRSSVMSMPLSQIDLELCVLLREPGLRSCMDRLRDAQRSS